MSSQVDRSSTPPVFVMWMLLFVAGFSFLQFGITGGLYYLLYGAPGIASFWTAKIPNYVHAVLWKDRVWYPVQKIGPGEVGGVSTLTSFDPEKGKVNESEIKIPFPTFGLLADAKGLWAVSSSAVTRVEDDASTDYQSKLTLKNPSEPFEYEGQLAVVERSKSGPPMLLVFRDKDWVDLGPIALPSDLTLAFVDGKQVLVAPPPGTSSTASLLDLQIVSHQGRVYTFVSNGSVVAYYDGLELQPVSALAPVNVPYNAELADLTKWEIVCPIAPLLIPIKNKWKAVIVDGKPVVINLTSSGTNPLQGGSALTFGRIDGSWRQTGQADMPAVIELLAVSNGQSAYVAGQSFVQMLRFHRVTNAGLSETGAILKAPTNGAEQPLQRLVEIYQFVYWIGLAVWAFLVSRLIAAYRSSDYEFGLTTVELASFLRRTIARVIDWLTYLGPYYLITVLFGLSSKEQVEQNMDKIFDARSGGFLMRFMLYLLCTLICSLFLLIVNSLIQGRWGVTLGKWICGIRTVRSTLRPCGFARAMVRELLLLVECFLASTWIPVTLLVALTTCQQRAGDLVADTIVIRKPTKPSDPEFKDSRT